MEELMVAAVKEFLFPKPVENWDFPTAVAARRKETISKIIQVVALIFATLATTAAFVFLSASVVGLAVGIPLLVATVASWGLTILLKVQQTKFTKGLDDATKNRLAKQETERLFFETPLKNYKDAKDIIEKFQNINKVLEMDAFNKNYVEAFKKLKTWENDAALGELTLYDAIQKHNAENPDKVIDLSLNQPPLEARVGAFFAPKRLIRHLEVKWNGKKDDGVLSITPQGVALPNPANEISFDLVSGLEECQKRFPAKFYKTKNPA
jgi:hypothetical protein